MAEETNNQQLIVDGNTVSSKFIEDLTEKLTKAMFRNFQPPLGPATGPEGGLPPMTIVFNGRNYGVWSQMVEVLLASKDKLGHINGERTQPASNDTGYKRWMSDNSMVKGWILSSLDPNLIGNFIRFSTAKEVWDSIKLTFFDGNDNTQIYDLEVKVYGLKQTGTLEDYFYTLQGLWKEIEFRKPNPMTCPIDIEKYNRVEQDRKVYIFLGGLEDRFDGIRAEILRMTPLPTVEETYGHVRREDVRQSVMVGKSTDLSNSAAMIVQGAKQVAGVPHISTNSTHGNSNNSVPGDPLSLSSQVQGKESSSNQGAVHFTTRYNKTEAVLKCTHCGGKGHSKDTCFKIHGYPDWYKELKKKQAEAKRGKVSIAVSGKNGDDSPSEGIIFLSSNLSNDNSTWIVDSGASDHMTFTKTDLTAECVTKKTEILNANGISYPVKCAGSIKVTSQLNLSNVLVVPSLATRLMSVSKLTKDRNCVVKMYSDYFIIQDILTKEIIGRGIERDGLYHLEDLKAGRASLVVDQTEVQNKIWTWHRRLGHPSLGYMKKLLPHLFKNNNLTVFNCDTCIKAKSHRVSYAPSSNKSNSPFDLIHSDVWGPAPVSSIDGNKWFVLFIDDCTRMTWVYLLKSKDEVPSVFKNFYTMIKTQFGKGIKFFRSDNGGEFIGKVLKDFFVQMGIVHETSCVGTPQQNGVAERKNRHILEMSRALLFEYHVPTKFWDKSILMAVYVLNRLPTKINNFQTPLKTLEKHHSIPSVLSLTPKIFGCVAYVHVPKTQRSKLSPYAVRCVFLGFGQNQKGYKCFDVDSRKWYVTMDVTFMEHEAFFKPTIQSDQGENSSESDVWKNKDLLSFQGWTPGCEQYGQDGVSGTDKSDGNGNGTDESDGDGNGATDGNKPLEMYSRNKNRAVFGMESENEEVIQPNEEPQGPMSPEDQLQVSLPTSKYTLPVRCNRGIPPKRYEPDEDRHKKSKYPIANFVDTKSLSGPVKRFNENLLSCKIPENVDEAKSDPNWSQAMEAEMSALYNNKTWTLVELPQGKIPVGCRWVFSIKYNANGEIDRYKARLVAKGYTQTQGIDFQETFSPVAKLNTIRVLLSLAANLDWPLHQFDVKNAFLHGELKEEVYMEQPPGYKSTNAKPMVCKLNKALYGLKQSPRAWFGRFCRAMQSYGFKQCDSDHTLFLKRNQEKLTALIIYVDDMIVTGNDTQEIATLEKKLSGEFEMKNLGGLKYFLGIEVMRSRQGIVLSQRKYILDLLAEIGMLDCRPADTPVVQGVKLGEFPDQVPANKERYQRLVGKLIYLAHTRPDIAYGVSVVSQFMHNPSEDHMDAVMRIIRYLKGCPGKGITFKKNGHLDVSGFTDADWAGSVSDRRSTAGYFTFVGGNLVTWRSKKQSVVALSSAEAEFRGVAKGICELLWLRRLLGELGFAPTQAMDLYCDSRPAIDISHNPVQHDRTKHVEIDRHFIKEKLESNVIQMVHVRSGEQLADILTKAVMSKTFTSIIDKLGMQDAYIPT